VNGNGHSERKELFTLGELNIVSIGLERANVIALDANASRNQTVATSAFKTADGQSHLVGDVALFADVGTCSCTSASTSYQPSFSELLVA
jgi:hypothetical protein